MIPAQPPRILPDWPAILAAGPALAGAKAWHLARLAHYGFPVPPGWVITAAEVENEPGTGEADAAFLTQITAQITAKLAQTIPHAQLPWRAARGPAPRWGEIPLAVRSSAPEEDGVTSSFAGIHHSVLNVQGLAALLAARAQVLASARSPAALAYRQGLGLSTQGLTMAVLVMPLIPAESSGIAFTHDPATGRDDRLILHANWGLGESLVGGSSEGDEICLAEAPEDDRLVLHHTRIGSKARQVSPLASGGTGSSTTPAAAARQSVLTPAQALALGELLRGAAQALDYAHPAYDLEWARHPGQGASGNTSEAPGWILQARPITALPPCTYPALRNQAVIWSRGNTREVVPEPLSPMDWASSRRLVNSLLGQGYRLTGLPLHPGAQRAGLFHGCLYLNLSLMQWEGYTAFGVSPGDMNRLVGGHQPEIQLPPATWRTRLQQGLRILRFLTKAPRLRRQGLQEIAAAPGVLRDRQGQLDALPHPVPTSALPRLQAWLLAWTRESRKLPGLFFLQGSGGASLSLLVRLLNRRFPGEGHALAAALLAGGEPSVTARQAYALATLARTALADPQVAAWLGQGAATRRPWQELPDSPFKQGFQEFLAHYGHRAVYETYLRNPRWAEAPDYLLDRLPELAKLDTATLAARQTQLAQTARARIRAAQPFWKRPLFMARVDLLSRQARQESNQREAARSALVAHLASARSLLLTLGEIWQAQGWLPQAEDIFLLLPAEIHRVLQGTHPGQYLAPLVMDRAQQLAASEAATQANPGIPDVLLVPPGQTRPQPWQGDPIPQAPASVPPGAPALATDTAGPPSRATFQGVAVGGGRARGRVRHLHHPEEGARLQPGEILLVAATDPAWTPLFLKAGGLIMETGGYLSHGAIVAREFGLPAVVNLPGILTRLHDGDLVEVDGQEGVVRVIGEALG